MLTASWLRGACGTLIVTNAEWLTWFPLGHQQLQESAHAAL